MDYSDLRLIGYIILKCAPVSVGHMIAVCTSWRDAIGDYINDTCMSAHITWGGSVISCLNIGKRINYSMNWQHHVLYTGILMSIYPRKGNRPGTCPFSRVNIYNFGNVGSYPESTCTIEISRDNAAIVKFTRNNVTSTVYTKINTNCTCGLSYIGATCLDFYSTSQYKTIKIDAKSYIISADGTSKERMSDVTSGIIKSHISSWNEVQDKALAFIKNKPNVLLTGRSNPSLVYL
jgi:hypothetical protein